MEKNLSFLILVIFVVQSRLYTPKKYSSIGYNCGGSYYLSITEFNVWPWPVQPGDDMKIQVVGVFNRAETVDYIATGQDLNHDQWIYNITDIGQTFSVNQIGTFNTSAQAGTASGCYNIQVTLKGPKPEDTYLACWSFSYELYNID
ncbi:hypothetical protein SteCoe_3539 [Stentor coeruleus]|uniref:MD-2-related lipid-recognition domain-containing protein n=1 Tax=Stentor coeruleus TaxID=5963 RepID=A0A1R2CWQ7_9CILI|nr:hypothetical protein SteCoe_3539 [Stentor coeruleus]